MLFRGEGDDLGLVALHLAQGVDHRLGSFSGWKAGSVGQSFGSRPAYYVFPKELVVAILDHEAFGGPVLREPLLTGRQIRKRILSISDGRFHVALGATEANLFALAVAAHCIKRCARNFEDGSTGFTHCCIQNDEGASSETLQFRRPLGVVVAGPDFAHEKGCHDVFLSERSGEKGGGLDQRALAAAACEARTILG